MQGPPQGPPACAASTGVSFPAHQHREDSASPTSARSCTARLAARLAAPGCAAHPRGPPRARCPNLPRTQARAESVLHAPSWTRRLLAAPVHPARPRSPALDTRAARARRWPAPARLRQHAHRLSRWLFAIESDLIARFLPKSHTRFFLFLFRGTLFFREKEKQFTLAPKRRRQGVGQKRGGGRGRRRAWPVQGRGRWPSLPVWGLLRVLSLCTQAVPWIARPATRPTGEKLRLEGSSTRCAAE